MSVLARVILFLALIFGFLEIYNLKSNVDLTTHSFPGEKSLTDLQISPIPLPGYREESARIDLSVPGRKLDSEIDSNHSNWLILDASKGVLPEYNKWIKKRFSTIQELTEEESVHVCWRRTATFPIATGLCSERKTRFVMNPMASDLSRTYDGKSTARLAHEGNVQLVLLTHQLPQNENSRDWMKEELCLDFLSKGQGCAIVDILPGTSLYAMSIKSTDLLGNKTLEDFDLAHASTVNAALAEFGEKAGPAPIYRDFPTGAKWCPGVDYNSQINVANLSWLKPELENITSHVNLLRAVHQFTDHAVCAGLYSFTLPELKMQDPRAGLRTIIQSLLEEPIWLTTPNSYAYRAKHIQNTSLHFESSNGDSTTWVQSSTPIKQLSLSFIMPEKFPEELLTEIKAGGINGEWRVNSLGSDSFRVVFKEVDDSAWVDLKSFIELLQKPQLRLSIFLSTPGIRLPLLASFLFAVLIVFVQLSSPSIAVKKYWWPSFAVVFGTGFILSFVSYHSARQMAGGSASVISIEGPNVPRHYFLQDWPEEWTVESSFLAQQQEEKLNEKQNSTFVLKPLQTQVLQSSKPRPVVIWSDIRARNFYFRRSITFEATLLGWKNAVNLESLTWKYVESSKLTNDILPNGGILIVPELAFATKPELEVIEKFVSEGGTLVFTAGLSDDSGVLDYSSFKGPFQEVLKSVGLGTTQLGHFLQINEMGFPVKAVESSHLVSQNSWIKGAKYGTGSIVFLGIQPLDSKSQSVSVTVIHRLQGEKLLTRDLGPGCVSALLVKNFASRERMVQLIDGAKAEGLEVRWLIDPNAFPNLIDKLGDRFVKDGVAFMDDNTGSGRFAAKRNWNSFLKRFNLEPRPLILVSERNPEPGVYNGPSVELIAGAKLDIAPPSQLNAIQNWQNECAFGIARPRIITEGRSNELDLLITNLKMKSFLSFDMRGLAEYQERHRESLSPGPMRKMNYAMELPILLERQAN